jgi:hypothetical protein
MVQRGEQCELWATKQPIPTGEHWMTAYSLSQSANGGTLRDQTSYPKWGTWSIPTGTLWDQTAYIHRGNIEYPNWGTLVDQTAYPKGGIWSIPRGEHWVTKLPIPDGKHGVSQRGNIV